MSGYIGTQPVPQATQTRDSFTATSGQTSFATGGYTPNYLDVYLNGVKLASADYTATNGSDVVLASGAATGDILEVVAFTTFTPASIPDGTPSIDDNGNATALTITSDENVLIGTTDINPYDNTTGSGIALRSSGAIYNAINNGTPLNLNRMGSDGTIAQFRQGGTAVGSIGAHSSGTYLGTADTGIYFNGGNDSIDPYNPSVPINRDNAISLGAGSRRFKDLYLSGGVYLGGTGSANKLDDVETGTFTPNVDTGSIDIAEGAYVKVGDLVHCTLTVGHSMNTTSSSPIQFNGLPFTSSNASDGSHGTVFCRYVNNFPNAVQVMTSNTRIRLWASGSTAFSTINHNNITSATYALFYIGLTYRAA
jgi:hypothetical protein